MSEQQRQMGKGTAFLVDPGNDSTKGPARAQEAAGRWGWRLHTRPSPGGAVLGTPFGDTADMAASHLRLLHPPRGTWLQPLFRLSQTLASGCLRRNPPVADAAASSATAAGRGESQLQLGAVAGNILLRTVFSSSFETVFCQQNFRRLFISLGGRLLLLQNEAACMQVLGSTEPLMQQEGCRQAQTPTSKCRY